MDRPPAATPAEIADKREAIAELTALAVSMGRDPGTAHRLASAVADRWFPDVTPPKHRHRSRDGRGSPCWPSPKQRGGLRPAPRSLIAGGGRGMCGGMRRVAASRLVEKLENY